MKRKKPQQERDEDERKMKIAGGQNSAEERRTVIDGEKMREGGTMSIDGEMMSIDAKRRSIGAERKSIGVEMKIEEEKKIIAEEMMIDVEKKNIDVLLLNEPNLRKLDFIALLVNVPMPIYVDPHLYLSNCGLVRLILALHTPLMLHLQPVMKTPLLHTLPLISMNARQERATLQSREGVILLWKEDIQLREALTPLIETNLEIVTPHVITTPAMNAILQQLEVVILLLIELILQKAIILGAIPQQRGQVTPHRIGRAIPRKSMVLKELLAQLTPVTFRILIIWDIKEA